MFLSPCSIAWTVRGLAEPVAGVQISAGALFNNLSSNNKNSLLRAVCGLKPAVSRTIVLEHEFLGLKIRTKVRSIKPCEIFNKNFSIQRTLCPSCLFCSSFFKRLPEFKSPQGHYEVSHKEARKFLISAVSAGAF